MNVRARELRKSVTSECKSELEVSEPSEASSDGRPGSPVSPHLSMSLCSKVEAYGV